MAQHNNGVVALPTNPERGQRVSIMSAQVQPGSYMPAVDDFSACNEILQYGAPGSACQIHRASARWLSCSRGL